jgi:hypothetical protein
MHPRCRLPVLEHKAHPKVKFTPAEDEQLAEVVSDLGTNDWEAVAKRLAGRNARQCRDRWDNYLSPSVFTGPWTPQEEQELARLVVQFGYAWKRIAGFFPSRSDVNVKSRWRRMQRRMAKHAIAEAAQMRVPQTAPLPVPAAAPFVVPLPKRPDPAPPDFSNDPTIFQSLMIQDDGGFEAGFESWF